MTACVPCVGPLSGNANCVRQYGASVVPQYSWLPGVAMLGFMP